MADNNNIFYKIEVHGEEGIATIRNMKGQFVQTKVPVTQLNEELAKMNGTMSLTTSEAGRQMAKFKRLRSRVQINSKEYQNLTNSMRAYQKQIDMSTGATGSASSAAMELGRVISDMPYGIRGVANNLSQFASQMAYSAKSTGGLKFAIKDLFSALTGPLGILLVIQAVIAAFDHFAGGAKKAQKEVTDLTSKTYASSLVAKQYVKELEDVNLTEERRKVVTQELIKLVPTLKKEDLKYGENLDKVRLKINSYALAQASRIEIDKLVQENSKELASKNELESIKQIENDKERISRMKKFILETGEDVSGFVLGFGDKAKIENEDINEIEETFKRLGKVIDKQSNPIIERIAELTKSLKLDPDKKGGGKGKGKIKLLEIDDFDKQAEDYLDKITSVSQKQEILNAELNSDKVKIQERYHLEALEAKNIENKAKFKQQAAAYKLEYQAFLDQQVRTTPMTKSEAKGLLDGFDEDIKAQQKASEDNFNVLIKKTKDFYFDKFFIALQGEQKIQKSKSDSQTKELEGLAFYVEQYTQLMGGIGDFLQAESDRELAIEQNKTNALNKELNDRLINENLSENQRKNIQNQIAQNDEALRVKQEAIKKKQFKQQKAFNISMAIISTYAAAAKTLNDTKGGSFARIAGMIAVIGSGLAQVAAISRQKYQSSSANTPIRTSTGGGGASQRSEPSFNIVGRSGDNLLINAIQAQFDKPLKAYVVSRDVTNQQQLDGMIVSQAGT